MYNWKRNMTGPEVIQELEANGWVFDSIRGSHHKYKRNGVSCPVPVHGNDTLKDGTFASIKRIVASSPAAAVAPPPVVVAPKSKKSSSKVKKSKRSKS